MAVNFTKDGNAIRVSIQGNKVIWLAVEDFMSAFTLNKLDNTVDIVAGKLTVNDVAIADIGLNGSYGIVTDQASLGAFIKFLTEVDADGVAAFSGDYNDLTNKPDLSSFATTTDLSTGLSGKENSIGFTPENVANKSTDVALGNSDSLYPSQKAVKTFVQDPSNLTLAATNQAGIIANALQVIPGWKQIAALSASGAFFRGYQTKASGYSINWTTDHIINKTGASAATMTLPTAAGSGTFAGAGAGREIIIINSGTGIVTMATTSSQTIDGQDPATTPLLLKTGEKVTFISDGSNWFTENNTTGLSLVAFKTNIDGHVLGNNDLDFAWSKSLASHFPVYFLFKYRSGTSGACAAKMKHPNGDVNVPATISLINPGMQCVITANNGTLMNGSGVLTCEVTTIAAAAFNFDVFAYGIPKA